MDIILLVDDEMNEIIIWKQKTRDCIISFLCTYYILLSFFFLAHQCNSGSGSQR